MQLPSLQLTFPNVASLLLPVPFNVLLEDGAGLLPFHSVWPNGLLPLVFFLLTFLLPSSGHVFFCCTCPFIVSSRFCMICLIFSSSSCMSSSAFCFCFSRASQVFKTFCIVSSHFLLFSSTSSSLSAPFSFKFPRLFQYGISSLLPSFLVFLRMQA